MVISTPAEGTIAGEVLLAGGSAPVVSNGGSPVGRPPLEPVPGQVTATNIVSGAAFNASAGANGLFTITVPPGTYAVTATNPQVGRGATAGPERVRVLSGAATHLDVSFVA